MINLATFQSFKKQIGSWQNQRPGLYSKYHRTLKPEVILQIIIQSNPLI